MRHTSGRGSSLLQKKCRHVLVCRGSAARAHSPRAALPGTPSAAEAVKLYVRTGWQTAKLHGSLQGGAWKDIQLNKVTSAPGKWMEATIRPPPSSSSSSSSSSNGSATPLLEFVVTDGGSQWDKPAAGGNYTITAPGTYTVRRGTLAPLLHTAPPVMLVSDLDGTMVGDDAATAAFKQFWEDEGVVRGGLLVYNTGRSLASFQSLLQEKGHCLAHPDVLLSAVGTKVYNCTPAGEWQEDKGWVQQLEQGWSGEAVRDAAYAALAKVGKEVMHFRPPEEQNQHKVTCGVAVSALQRVQDAIQGRLDAARVKANIITSGTGDWRFVDLVPIKAGKLKALEYVRQQHGFSHAHTIACGDSGNDILMLSGRNLAVVVGNAQPDLLAWLGLHEADESPLPGKQRLLKASKHEAYGILEGLAYWGYL